MIFITEYGMSTQQEKWFFKASKDEQNAFLLSAPLRIAVQPCLCIKTGSMTTRFIPTLHGIPVARSGSAQVFEAPEEAQAEGEAFLQMCRDELEGRQVDLDLKKLRIAGPAVEEYSTPDGRQQAFLAVAKAEILGGQDLTPVEA